MRLKLFKNKEQRKKFLMSIFVLMMFGSVFAFLFGYPFMSAMNNPEETVTEQDMLKKFSNQGIFEGELSTREKNFLIQKGITIGTYYYTGSSDSFELEQLVQRLGRQLVIEKVKGNETKIEFISNRDSVMVKNMSDENVLNALCEVLYQPPPECAP